jgi:hypothetical protein
MNEDVDTLRKAARKGRGKVAQAQKALWLDAFKGVIRTNPCGTVLIEGADGKPRTESREFTKKNAWAFELLDKSGQEWQYATALNLDKSGGAIRFTHTLKWCMAKLKRDEDLFTKGTYDKCRARLRNLVGDDFIMIAVLLSA